MNESTADTLRLYWSIIIRRKWVIAGIIVMSLALAHVLYVVLPKSYRSQALILVEEQQVPENYVPGINEGKIEKRIFMIQQRIMAKTLLAEIVADLNVYPDELRTGGIEDAIGKVRGNIEVEMVRPDSPRDIMIGLDAFTIGFSHQDPVMAKKVAERLVSRFVEESLKQREQAVEGASEFLDAEVKKVKVELEKKEDEITQFKAEHMGELPQQVEANLRALDRLQDEINGVNESLQRQTDRLSMIENGIGEYQMTGNITSGLAGTGVAPNPLIQRFIELSEKLAVLSAEYKDTYPDIILTRQELENVKMKLVERYGPEAIKFSNKPFDPFLKELKKQRDVLVSELQLFKQRRQTLNKQKFDFEARVESAPTVEQELLILIRDYDNMKNNYGSLLDKRLNARLVENLEKRQKGEQFKIIDPPGLPGAPYRPDKRKLLALGVIFGCGLGFVVVYLLESLNPTFRRPEDFHPEWGTRVLAAIPDFQFLYGHSAGPLALPGPDTNDNGAAKHSLGSKTAGLRRRLLLHSNGKIVPPQMNLVTKWLPGSMVAEQYRVAATRLALVGAKNGSTVVGVTSAIKGEGKTTTVVNLGYTLARDLGKRTLLVDCDLRCPALHGYVPPGLGVSLVDLLARDASFDGGLAKLGDAPCWVLPSSLRPIEGNELLKSHRLAALFEDLRREFDYIIINAPPVLPVADMNILSRLADLLFLVVRAGFTPQDVVRQAVEALGNRVPIHIILNAVEARSLPYYMFYSYQADGSEPRRE